jgi:hypothetical protein
MSSNILTSNSISLYDEKILDYLVHDLWVDYGDTVRHPQIHFAMSGTRQNLQLDLSDNNTPILPLITVIRRSIEPHEATKIIRTHVPKKPLYYTYTEDGKYARGVDFMPYNFTYDVDIWTLTQRSLLDITNFMIWKFLKEPSFSVRGIFGEKNVNIPGYVEDYSYQDQSSYEEIGNEEDRILRGTFNLKIYGNLIKAMPSTGMIDKHITQILIEDPIVNDDGCYIGNNGGKDGSGAGGGGRPGYNYGKDGSGGGNGSGIWNGGKPGSGIGPGSDKDNIICGNFTSAIKKEQNIDITMDELDRDNVPYTIITTERDMLDDSINFEEKASVNTRNIAPIPK